MLCGSLDGRGVWGRVDTETITTLLIGYTPIKMFKKFLKIISVPVTMLRRGMDK